jgi:hypothetical protein
MINDFNDFLFAILLWIGTTIFLFNLFSENESKSPSKKSLTPVSLNKNEEILTQENNLAKQKEIESLKQQCHQLRLQLKQQSAQLKQDFQNETLTHLNSLIISYPTAKKMAEIKPDLPAKNLLALLTPLDTLIQNWGFEMIGQPWEKVKFDPQFHQGDRDDLEIGEDVYIRFVGYRDGEDILYPAKVSKTLPQGFAHSI